VRAGERGEGEGVEVVPATQPFLTGFEGEERRRDLSQFYTPPHVAARMWRWACPPSSRRLTVLEPAAGRGALILPMLTDTTRPKPVRIVAYEVDPGNVEALLALAKEHPEIEVRARDFRADDDPGRFDLCQQNPPYEDSQDFDFILRSLRVSRQTVALVRSAIEHGQNRWNEFTRHVEQRRKVNFIERPSFGGEDSPKTDFKILDLCPRRRPLMRGEPTTVNQEWW